MILFSRLPFKDDYFAFYLLQGKMLITIHNIIYIYIHWERERESETDQIILLSMYIIWT